MNDLVERRFRYLSEADLDRESSETPHFDLAERFIYDREMLGSPTLPKLAREAIRLLDLDSDPDLLHWWGKTEYGGRRVWIWNDDGEFMGSVIVTLDFEPRLTALDDTIQRSVEA